MEVHANVKPELNEPPMTPVEERLFVKLIEQKVERANKSLKMLPVEDQGRFRVMIDQAYAYNIDRLRKQIPVLQTAPVQNIPVE